MSKYKVLIGSRSFGRATSEPVQRLTDAGCQVILNTLGRAYREMELYDALVGMDAIITGVDELSARALERADRLKVISKHGVGLDNVDVAAAQAKGIVVTATPEAIHDSVADLTFGLLLALARQIVPAHIATTGGKWDRFVGVELRDKVLGIVGLGRIGKGVALRAQAFGMRAIAYDVYPDTNFAQGHNIQFVSLDELLAQADFVTLHAALLSGGKPILGERELALLQPHAFLLNTARGGLIDEPALLNALRSHSFAGAALDVFQREPPTDSPLLAMDNVIVTSHIAGLTREGLARMDDLAAENVLRVLQGPVL